MKKYIQPSLKVREIELAVMIAGSPSTEVDDNPENGQDASKADIHAYRGWNLWGVED